MNEQIFRFAFPDRLYALIGVGVCIIIYILYRLIAKRKLNKLADKELLSIIIPDYSPFRKTTKFILIVIAASCLIIAWAQPQYGGEKQTVNKKGIEIAIALDISNSMLAEDITPNRIDYAKFSIQKIINKLEQNKISIVTFAGESYIQLPMTTDVGAAKMFLQNISTNNISKQGTAIGSAIAKCTRTFSGNDKVSKMIIIISDGENHEDDAIYEAKQAKEKGIIINTVGMGSVIGSPIPIIKNNGQKDYLKTKDGQPVTTKLNEQMLQNIAQAGGGIYSHEDFDPILQFIDKMEKADFETTEFNVYNERYQIFLFIALFCLIIEIFILDRKNHWMKEIDIFKINLGKKK